jgi:isochorismate synthase
LHAFQQLQLGESFFWEQPAQQKALVGTGVTSQIEAHGAQRFTSATQAWSEVQRDALVVRTSDGIPETVGGPLFFGGFAFDALAPRTELWEGFPDGLLVLPTLQFHACGQHTTLTLNRMVQPDCDVSSSAREVNDLLKRVQVALHAVASWSPTLDVFEQDVTQHELVARDVWEQIVAQAVTSMQQGAYQKVVLARAVQIHATEGDFDLLASLARLRTSYTNAYVFAIQRGRRYFIGATPERLVYGHDGQLRTVALAGSAPRGATPEEDCRLGTALLQSQKNQHEHQVVVETIRENLADLCSKVWIADAPHLLQIRNIQHLQTPIVGELRPGHCVLEALEVLHPTPAVGGFPTQVALQAIREHEQLDRGWYAGPVGWIDRLGNGEFAVALRSGLVDGNVATLFGGGGIVPDSQPASEYAESCVKMQVMLRGLLGKNEGGITF